MNQYRGQCECRLCTIIQLVSTLLKCWYDSQQERTREEMKRQTTDKDTSKIIMRNETAIWTQQILCLLDRASFCKLNKDRPTWCHLLLLFHYLLLNMFRMLVHPSSEACDLLWIYFVCCVALVRCVLVLRCGSAGVVWYPYGGVVSLCRLKHY